jgi:hypothetical protein
MDEGRICLGIRGPRLRSRIFPNEKSGWTSVALGAVVLILL